MPPWVRSEPEPEGAGVTQGNRIAHQGAGAVVAGPTGAVPLPGVLVPALILFLLLILILVADAGASPSSVVLVLVFLNVVELVVLDDVVAVELLLFELLLVLDDVVAVELENTVLLLYINAGRVGSAARICARAAVRGAGRPGR